MTTFAQKFRRGDLVRIAKTMPPSMSHFPCDQEAIVIGSYADKYVGKSERDYQQYTLLRIETGGENSWYDEYQLTFIRHVGEEGIANIKAERDERDKIESNLDWILANWKNIRQSPPGATTGKLMQMIGITNPWGSRGEGITYFTNVMATISLLDNVLSSGDKAAVEARCREIKSHAPR